MKQRLTYITPQLCVADISNATPLCLGSNESEFGGNGNGIPAAAPGRRGLRNNDNSDSYLPVEDTPPTLFDW